MGSEMCIRDRVELIVMLYPVASATGFQEIFVSTAILVSVFTGTSNVVQFGTVGVAATIVNVSVAQLRADPVALNGVIVTLTTSSLSKLIGGLYVVLFPLLKLEILLFPLVELIVMV